MVYYGILMVFMLCLWYFVMISYICQDKFLNFIFRQVVGRSAAALLDPVSRVPSAKTYDWEFGPDSPNFLPAKGEVYDLS